MTAKNYVFRATRNPSNREIHCLWATLTDKLFENKGDIVFKIISNGKQVQGITSAELTARDVSLGTNEFKYLRTETVAPSSIEIGQVVSLQGNLSYSVHRTATGKDECPVDAFGQIKPTLKTLFLAYMTRETGVDFEEAVAMETLELSWENLSSPDEKVWLNDVISFSATARVLSAEKVNKLTVGAIGRRKSYGLGCVLVAGASGGKFS